MTEPPVGVTATSSVPGVVPVAFVAYVEYVDSAGEKQVVRVVSDGCSPERAERIEGAT